MTWEVDLLSVAVSARGKKTSIWPMQTNDDFTWARTKLLALVAKLVRLIAMGQRL